ncbi:MAG: plasmid maintenance system killer [Alphaproteobacteria bacterium]|nr:plasmid maintenance system killer [Alphaproteobacteria bacterium]
MLGTFKHKGLEELHHSGRTARINKQFHARIIRRLDALNAAVALADLNVPGFDLHPLHTTPIRYSIHVNGPWCITFEWDDDTANKLDFVQYH